MVLIGLQFYDVYDWQIKQKLHRYSACHNFNLVDQCIFYILIQVMDVSCMVTGCFNRVKQNGISFHQLSIKDFTGLQKWLNNIKLKNLNTVI